MKRRCQTRKAIANTAGTLDRKHGDTLTKFNSDLKSIPEKKAELATLERELSEINAIEPHKLSQEFLRRKFQISDKIDAIRMDITNITRREDELEYIDKTLPILLEYYDIKNTEPIDEYCHDQGDEPKGILSFFATVNKETDNNNTLKNNPDSSPKKSKKKAKTRAMLHSEYLNIVDINYRNHTKINDTKCADENCDGTIILSYGDSHYVCDTCGLTTSVLLTADKPNYKEPVQDSGTYAYKRINHLTEILSQLQAKESTDIPAIVYDTINKEIRKRNIDRDGLDIFSLRKLLKKIKFDKYYEHVPHILCVINQKKPPNFSRKDEMKIKQMFRDIQEPFALYCPKTRKNFLKYSYVLHKFCELLMMDEYIPYFPLLKNNAKLIQHDKIWEKICNHMRWKYYKSI